MAITQVTGPMVATNAIAGTIIADNAITAVHIATNAISGTLIADNAVTAVHIAQNSITVTQLADDAVEADKIADGVITTNHLNSAMISSQTEVTANSSDYVLIGDSSDSNALKKAATAWLLLTGGTMTGNITIDSAASAALILDRASVHKSKKVKEFLAKNPDVKLIWQPKGSPYLNMIEQCWKISKYALLVSEYYAMFSVLSNTVSQYFRTTKFKLDIANYIFRNPAKMFTNF